MPYIETKTSAKVTKEKELALKEALGKAIELIPGKSERWLMLNLIDECRMALAGTTEPDVAMVEVDIFGTSTDDAFDALTARICKVVNEIIGINKDRIYVKYREVDRWGWNGMNF